MKHCYQTLLLAWHLSHQRQLVSCIYTEHINTRNETYNYGNWFIVTMLILYSFSSFAYYTLQRYL